MKDKAESNQYTETEILKMKQAASEAFITHYVTEVCKYLKESPAAHLAQYEAMLDEIDEQHSGK
ncbi:hypothetical protein C942_00491 [Photobacterium marinum]|uniref:Uncharacterized protein n=1 Tax=Photobacterium marinum TaxID=1056511 RepID=L8JEU1_9GAMM|nr:hypothetical protein [Photobacterium marinum]ELR66049.1 hypothetical protein C942_00491 [Photobacterium marinum]